jgi:hypothetical protein
MTSPDRLPEHVTGAWTYYPRPADARLAAELDREAEADRAEYAARVAAAVELPEPEPQAENSQTELAPPLDVCQPFIDAARAADPALHDMDALSVLDILHERNAAEKTREAEYEYEYEYEYEAEQPEVEL